MQKSIDKIQRPFMKKTLNKVVIEGTYIIINQEQGCRQEKEIKGIQVRKEEVKLLLFVR